MKTTIAIVAAVVLLLTPVFGAENEASTFDKEKAAKNLLNNLNSENKGVRESSAFLIGELKIDDAVVPLLAILHNDTNESTRIVAALSLSKIGSARGSFAVKQAAIYDDSQRVRMACAWFSNMYSTPQPFVIAPSTEVEDTKMVASQQVEQ